MRRLLDAVYRGCGAAAAIATLAIAVLVVAQVGGRLAGVLVAGADDLAGYALTASSFLALAHTLRSGGHIRMTLLLRQASPFAIVAQMLTKRHRCYAPTSVSRSADLRRGIIPEQPCSVGLCLSASSMLAGRDMAEVWAWCRSAVDPIFTAFGVCS